ncbi:hypothetical protein [Chitinophaga sp.]|uniref:hypothetical protein n=1 Tax=Chitinophaga sp. TaxID=1869181 RepID=UPI0031D0EE73
MSFVERHLLVRNEDLRVKTKMAVIKAANAVLSAPEREQEHKFCYLVISEPENTYWLDQIMYSTVSNPAITEASTDSDIEFTVNSVFGRHALAFNR